MGRDERSGVENTRQEGRGAAHPPAPFSISVGCFDKKRGCESQLSVPLLTLLPNAPALCHSPWPPCGCTQDVLRVVEQVLGFDRSLEEDLAYPTAGLPAPPPLTWPTAAEVC
jgi:hypothetical protein